MIDRRSILKAGLGLGLGAGLDARGGAADSAASQGDGASARPRQGDLLVKAGDATNTPAHSAIDMLTQNGSVSVV